MNKMTTNRDAERFQSGTDKYAAYLKTPESRLCLDLTSANLRDFLPEAVRSLLALDLGCGTGSPLNISEAWKVETPGRSRSTKSLLA